MRGNQDLVFAGEDVNGAPARKARDSPSKRRPWSSHAWANAQERKAQAHALHSCAHTALSQQPEGGQNADAHQQTNRRTKRGLSVQRDSVSLNPTSAAAQMKCGDVVLSEVSPSEDKAWDPTPRRSLGGCTPRQSR